MKQWIKTTVRHMIGIVNYIYPKSRKDICLASNPDMADNTFALFKYLLENRRGAYRYTWILQNPEEAEQYKKMISEYIDINRHEVEDIIFVGKKTIRGLIAYFKSSYVFTSNGLFNQISFPKNQIMVSLWHGMPLKTIGCWPKTGSPSTAIKCPDYIYAIATSRLYRQIIAEAFSLPEKQVLVTGQPRCDLVYDNNDGLSKLGIERSRYTKILLWAPTFRKGTHLENIADGTYSSSFPVVDFIKLSELNRHLEKLNSFLIIKIHTLDILNTKKYGNYSNILIIKNEDLLNASCQVTSLLREIDILLTDYSSIYIDYLLLNRPIVFITDDFDAYHDNRGFVFDDPTRYMPGEVVDDYNGLIRVLYKLIAKGEDTFVDERQRVCELMHEVTNNFSQNLADRLEM